MNTEFCTNCGFKVEYTLNKPKFCSSCGSSLDPAAEITSALLPEESQASLEVEGESVPNITKLEYSIDRTAGNLTFGDLVAQASNDPNNKYQKIGSRPAPKDIGEDALKQTMAQCRSAREPIDLGGE